jgi:hypothetical protein
MVAAAAVAAVGGANGSWARGNARFEQARPRFTASNPLGLRLLPYAPILSQ